MASFHVPAVPLQEQVRTKMTSEFYTYDGNESKKSHYVYDGEKMTIREFVPQPLSISFNDTDHRGILSFVNGKLVFDGNISSSAKIFFEYVMDPLALDRTRQTPAYCWSCNSKMKLTSNSSFFSRRTKKKQRYTCECGISGPWIKDHS